jgi:Protein of unknown function (DUF2442)
MTTSAHRPGPQLSARAVDARVTDDELQVWLEDGRRVAVPLAWFPHLERATPEQRSSWRLIGRGVGINWPDLDEDISVENLLGGDRDLLTYRDETVRRAEAKRGARRGTGRGKPVNNRGMGRPASMLPTPPGAAPGHGTGIDDEGL